MRVSRDQLAFSFEDPTPAPYTLTCADVLDWAEETPPIGAMACLCDPPYSLGDGKKGFMSKAWDNDIAFKPETWKALAQHLLPGAFVMAFSSARTYHRLACALEDAGLVLHPALGWLHGQGFPKATRIDAVLEKQRQDYSAIKVVVYWLREAASRAGYSAEGINSTLGWGSAVAKHFLALSESNAGVPTCEQWLQLKALLQFGDEMDAEVWRLNGRKGQPGETWAQREVIGANPSYRMPKGYTHTYDVKHNPLLTAPATPIGQIWAGHRYGLQALKPALEFIAVAQVPYAGKPVQSITQTGAGSLWIDGARLNVSSSDAIHTGRPNSQGVVYADKFSGMAYGQGMQDVCDGHDITQGRWPPNFCISHLPECVQVGTRQVRGAGWTDADQRIKTEGYRWAFDGREEGTQHYTDANGQETVAEYRCSDQCPVRLLDVQAGVRTSHGRGAGFIDGLGYHGGNGRIDKAIETNTGSASRFFAVSDWSLDVAEQLTQANPAFYCSKASRGERSNGLPDGQQNRHPCVKPLTLLVWLCKLLAPPAAYAPRRLLVPFAGSGSECIAASCLSDSWEEVIGIESNPEYVELAEQRLAYWLTQRERHP